jgi:hypothetical protein
LQRDNVKPIQYMLRLWRQLTVKGAQASIAVRENRHRGAFIYSSLSKCKASRTHRFAAAIAYKSKARGLSILIEHLPRHNLKVPLRSLVSSANVSPVQTNNGVFARIEIASETVSESRG